MVTDGFAVLEPAGVNTSEKITCPDNSVLPDGLGVTVAVNVTDRLSPDGSVGLLTTTAVPALFTICVNELELPPKFVSWA
jgi:hypothetical protein